MLDSSELANLRRKKSERVWNRVTCVLYGITTRQKRNTNMRWIRSPRDGKAKFLIQKIPLRIPDFIVSMNHQFNSSFIQLLVRKAQEIKKKGYAVITLNPARLGLQSIKLKALLSPATCQALSPRGPFITDTKRSVMQTDGRGWESPKGVWLSPNPPQHSCLLTVIPPGPPPQSNFS